MLGDRIQIGFSFLTTGPPFEAALPSEFRPVPKLSAPINIYGAGGGGRSFDFISSAVDGGMRTSRYLGTLTGTEGRTVELYERDEEPRIWWLRWPLASGAIYAHLREEDGAEMADVVASRLGIVETEFGTPFLLPSAPLEPGVAGVPGYQEFAAFESTRAAIGFRRPGYLEQGRRRVRARFGQEFFKARAGAPFGVEISVITGASDAGWGREVLELLLSTFREG